MPISKSYKRSLEQQEVIEETIQNHDTDTGVVVFPDNNTLRIQFICNGECPPDLLNAINGTVEGHYHVSQISHWSDKAFLVELER